MSHQSKPAVPAPAFIWWILWAGVTAGLGMVYFTLGRSPVPDSSESADIVPYLITGMLFASCVVRWLVLPRIALRQKALPVFILGMALAEGCGLLAILLLRENRDSFLTLAFLGLAQYAPIFVSRFEA